VPFRRKLPVRMIRSFQIGIDAVELTHCWMPSSTRTVMLGGTAIMSAQRAIGRAGRGCRGPLRHHGNAEQRRFHLRKTVGAVREVAVEQRRGAPGSQDRARAGRRGARGRKARCRAGHIGGLGAARSITISLRRDPPALVRCSRASGSHGAIQGIGADHEQQSHDGRPRRLKGLAAESCGH